MEDADSDADTAENQTIRYVKNIRCSLWYFDTTGYAFLCIRKHLRP